ncbi:MAG TPA: hypothetical protein VKA46_42295 [Gemmataceae bacterium]|nr:hypothetical protein [Gemmataceae bacterium]
MRLLILVLTAAVAGTGCTAVSLERHTLNQIHSTADERYREVLNSLAAVAADAAELPSFALLADGATRVQDTESINSITTWARAVDGFATGFATESLGVTVGRSPQEQWTLSPIAEHSRLEALRCACRWVLYGPERACASCPGLLADPRDDPSPGPHFGVADRLARLPTGWLHVGQLKDVPARAPYKGHWGSTWVWVMPEGTEGLAGFTLVFLDIATLDQSAIEPPPVLVTLARERLEKNLSTDPFEPGKVPRLVFPEVRVIRPEYRALIAARIQSPVAVETDDARKGKDERPKKRVVPITWEEWMAYTTPYEGQRANLTAQGGGTVSGLPAPPIPPPGTLRLESSRVPESLRLPESILPPGGLPLPSP